MSKTLTSIVANFDDKSSQSYTDPRVIGAAQAAINALTVIVPPVPKTPVVIPPVVIPAAPAAVDQVIITKTQSLVQTGAPDLIPVAAHDNFYSLPAGTFPFSPKTFTGANVSIKGAPLDAHGNPTTILKLSGTGARWAFNLAKSALNWKFANITIDCDPQGGGVQPLYGNQCDVVMENFRCTNGTLFAGHGAKSASLYNCWMDGVTAQYVVSNFDQPLAYFHWDNSLVDHPIHQGINQAACRYMQVTYGHIIGVHVVGSNFKQAVQVRSGGQIIHENCIIESKAGSDYCVDVGPMTWQDYSSPANTPDPLTLARFINCTLGDLPTIQRPGNRDTVKEVDYVNCKINGVLTNKTITAASWPPKTAP